MEFNKKKIIIAVGILLAAILIAIALYFVFFRSSQPDQYAIVDGQAVPVGQLPDIGDGLPPGIVIDPNTGLPVLVDNPNQVQDVLDQLQEVTPTEVKKQPDTIAQGGDTEVNRLVRGDIQALAGVGDTRFYNADDGKFYHITNDGEVVTISDAQFYGVENVAWNKRGENAVLEFPDGSNIYYDFINDRQVTLPQQMTEFDFSYDGAQIAFEWENTYDDQDNWLGVAAPDGSKLEFAEPIGDKQDRIIVQNSPDSRYIALYTKGTGLDRQDIIPVGKNGENFKSFTVFGRGFESQWSPDGKTMLYSVHSDASDRKPVLWVAQISGESVGQVNKPLQLETWSHKCTFSSSGSQLYCAVPQGLPSGVGWFPELDDQYPDQFYQVDLNTGQKTLLANPVGTRNGYSASQVVLSDDESTLYFIDSITNDIFSINLK